MEIVEIMFRGKPLLLEITKSKSLSTFCQETCQNLAVQKIISRPHQNDLSDCFTASLFKLP